jgi:hypothetical protein
MRRFVVIAAAAALMAGAVAPGAHASGKGGGGGSGSSGGGGGGGGRGGGNDPAPAPPVSTPVTPLPVGPPCAAFVSASASVGYFDVYAAIWHDYFVRDCSGEAEDIDVETIDADCETGRVDFDETHLISLGAGQQQSGLIDNDSAPYSTTYCVTYVLHDPVTGVEYDRSTLTATTPPERG